MVRSNHFRTPFRVLRPDKGSKLTTPLAVRDNKRAIREKATDHITDGSSSAYRSSLMSCTSELKVALAFGGIMSRIAVIDPQPISEKNVVHLDKEHLRQDCFVDLHAVSRSKRSDEVVVDESIQAEQCLNVRINDCRQFLCPGFSEDADCFLSPRILSETKLTNLDCLGSANKRLFRVQTGPQVLAARPPRPSVSLDQPLLFNEDSITQRHHEFAAFCACRHLTSPALVPRCALCTFDLSYDAAANLVPAGRFHWSCLLMEDLKMLPFEPRLAKEMKSTATNLFGADLSLGN